MADKKPAKKPSLKPKKAEVKTVKKPVKNEVKVTKKVSEGKNGAIQKDNKTPNKASTNKEEVTTTDNSDSSPKPLAKAGKRSEKAIKEAEQKQQKEAKKAESAEEDQSTGAKKAKIVAKPARSRRDRKGKSYRKAVSLIDKDKEYDLEEASLLISKSSWVKFDATVELHVNLNLDPRHADQNIRDNVVMPAGTGKNIKIAVLAEEADAKAAKQAGADEAGNDELLAKLEKEIIDFDVLIAAPSLMAKLSKHARLLGPKGLMPNPKSGTVTKDVAKAVKEAKAGRVEYRVDSTGIVHIGVGKVSFGPEKLKQNIDAVLGSIKTAKPPSVKGTYVHSIYLTTTMGPSVKINSSAIS